jgi:hypothetical protein
MWGWREGFRLFLIPQIEESQCWLLLFESHEAILKPLYSSAALDEVCGDVLQHSFTDYRQKLAQYPLRSSRAQRLHMQSQGCTELLVWENTIQEINPQEHFQVTSLSKVRPGCVLATNSLLKALCCSQIEGTLDKSSSFYFLWKPFRVTKRQDINSQGLSLPIVATLLDLSQPVVGNWGELSRKKLAIADTSCHTIKGHGLWWASAK